MIRQATGEQFSPAVYLDDADGLPATGLVPVALAWRKSDGAVLTPPTVTEIGGGFYRLDWPTPPTADAVVRVDAGASLGSGRYVPLEVVVGGHVDLLDNLDVAVSTRATPDDLTPIPALGGSLT